MRPSNAALVTYLPPYNLEKSSVFSDSCIANATSQFSNVGGDRPWLLAETELCSTINSMPSAVYCRIVSSDWRGETSPFVDRPDEDRCSLRES